eukprot:Tbor_TRINITY_DN5148_c0_g1::TRINITY_DN5148_c0_g1_i1::g.25781::m.25781
MTVEVYKAKGNAAFQAKNYQEAISNYTKAIELDPASTNAGALYSNRAASYTSLQDYIKALEDAESCIRVRPDWLKGYFRKGIALEGLSRYDEAACAYGEAFKVDPKNEEVMEKLQGINSTIRNRNNAAKPEKCRTAEEAKSIGNSLFRLGKYEVAITFYSRAIDLYPAEISVTSDTPTKEKLLADKANTYTNRAACHQQTHNYRQMICDCEEALLIDENHIKALLRRAIGYEGLEKWQKALDDYNAVNRLSPGMCNVSQGILHCKRALS